MIRLLAALFGSRLGSRSHIRLVIVSDLATSCLSFVMAGATGNLVWIWIGVVMIVFAGMVAWATGAGEN
jgi:hypothetical protein